MDYLGNKVGLASEIVRLTPRRGTPGGTVSDVFAGTGSVSLAYANAGFRVEANDHLPLSVTWTKARLEGANATFGGLREAIGPLGSDPLGTITSRLAALPGLDGWITRNYSPASFDRVGVERRYFTESNARLIDAIRHQIREWRPLITEVEHSVLLTCLLEGASNVSNIAGTYGSYLKHWKATALRPLRLEAVRDFAPSRQHEVTCRDAELVAAESCADVIYADPPYTKRQYGAYYHLLNSIAADIEPDLTGSTGLPDWRPFASEWCYKKRAVSALERLVAKSSAPVLVLSYSSDGHIADETIRAVLGGFGRVDVHEFERRRYRSSSLPHRGSTLVERLYVMQR